jgi:hypothetical protein
MRRLRRTVHQPYRFNRLHLASVLNASRSDEGLWFITAPSQMIRHSTTTMHPLMDLSLVEPS